MRRSACEEGIKGSERAGPRRKGKKTSGGGGRCKGRARAPRDRDAPFFRRPF